MPKVLFTIAGLHPESGGPSRSVPELCAALGRAGVEVEIVAHHYGNHAQPAQPPPSNLARTTYVPCDTAWQFRLQWAPRFKSVLQSRCQEFKPHIVHDTGMWLSTNRAASAVTADLNIPRIVSPRGMLSGWALHHKSWKKRLAWAAYQHRDLQSAKLIHVTSAAEAADVRAAGLTQPVAVIPNGVEIPGPRLEIPDPQPGQQKKTLLFMGRVHPVKGLLNLVTAWASTRPQGWRVVIAGRDEMNHQSELETAARAAGVADDFTFTGMVDGANRWDLYREADLFVLPSHSENFGIVVAEALAASVPVIATQGTPWQDLVTHRCGWWVEVGATPLAEALRHATGLTDAERQEMGRRGRTLVESNYSWTGVAQQMGAVYEWLLGNASQPACVQL